jgi:DNA-binding NarL/FixJ family response regulator
MSTVAPVTAVFVIRSTAKQAGASGFLLKDAPPDDLIAGIRQVARGCAPCPLGHETIDRRVQQPPAPGTTNLILAQPSQRESEVLRLVARGLSNMLSTLGCRDRVQFVIRAYETGIVLPGRTG